MSCATERKGYVKKYLTFFRIQFSGALQYRAAALGGITTQFAWGFMSILLYKAFYTENAVAFPRSFDALVSYIWLQQAFLAIFMLWFLDNDIFAVIRNGNVAYELVRPIDLYNMWFVKNAAVRLAKAVLRCFPILLVTVFLPAPYGLSMPAGASAFLLFLLTMFLGFLVVSSFCMLIYIVAFFTLNPTGIRIMALSLTELLAGAVVPLPFFPDGIRQIALLTPFAAMQNLPLRAYSGDVAGTELYSGILLQVFWLAVMLAAGKIWMKKAIKNTVVQGG